MYDQRRDTGATQKLFASLLRNFNATVEATEDTEAAEILGSGRRNGATCTEEADETRQI